MRYVTAFVLCWSGLAWAHAHEPAPPGVPGQCLRVIDADTLEVLVETRPRLYERFVARIYGIDAFEVRPRRGTPAARAAEKKRAESGARFVARALDCPWSYGKRLSSAPVDLERWPLRVVRRGRGGRGRVLADVYLGRVNVGRQLLELGHAKEYKP